MKFPPNKKYAPYFESIVHKTNSFMKLFKTEKLFLSFITYYYKHFLEFYNQGYFDEIDVLPCKEEYQHIFPEKVKLVYTLKEKLEMLIAQIESGNHPRIGGKYFIFDFYEKYFNGHFYDIIFIGESNKRICEVADYDKIIGLGTKSGYKKSELDKNACFSNLMFLKNMGVIILYNFCLENNIEW